MPLVDWLRQFTGGRLRRPKPEPVSLDLHQQIALHTLHRFGGRDFQALLVEVSAHRPTTQAQLVNGILQLEAANLIERSDDSSLAQARRPYRLTRRGRRVAKLIPADPRSALQVYI